MPVPSFSGSPSWGSLEDIRKQLNSIVGELNFFFANLDSLNVKHLTADHVDTGTLDANLVTIAADDGSFSYTLDGTGIKAFNGSVNTLDFDLATGLLTIVSAIMKSQTGYPQIAFNVNSNLMQAFTDANNHIDMTTSAGGAPGMAWYVANVLTAYMNCTSAGPLLAAFNSTPLTLQSNGGNINLTIGGNLTVNNAIGQTGTVYVSATSGGVANIPITFSKGVRTS